MVFKIINVYYTFIYLYNVDSINYKINLYMYISKEQKLYLLKLLIHSIMLNYCKMFKFKCNIKIYLTQPIISNDNDRTFI